jgi:hypothetical protein
MNAFTYQRLVIGYHGCDESTQQNVLMKGKPLNPSEQSYDWLGKGIYFWEHGPERAFQWAEAKHKRNPEKLKKPAVLGAVIHLGLCFDLLDTKFTSLLENMWYEYENECAKADLPVPQNRPLYSNDKDMILRELDCAVINWTLDTLNRGNTIPFDTVRGVFQEGEAAFPGSSIRAKSHIQVAVRNPACILGFFKPS